MRIKLFHQFENYISAPLPPKEEKVISFTRQAFEEFNEWRVDKQMQDKIIVLIQDILRDPFRGLGKPEHLKGKENGKGAWSRRIDQKHRLVYEVSGASIKILACKGHYDD